VTNAAGILRQIQALLTQPDSLTCFIKHHEDGDLWATWGLACRYHLRSLLKAVEGRFRKHQAGFVICGKKEMKSAIAHSTSLPTASMDVALCSMCRLMNQ
jgi:hypothetical protein